MDVRRGRLAVNETGGAGGGGLGARLASCMDYHRQMWESQSRLIAFHCAGVSLDVL